MRIPRSFSVCSICTPYSMFCEITRADSLEFNPTERILSEETNLELGELLYEDLFKDTETCGPKVNKMPPRV